MAFKRAMWRSGLTYQQTCRSCSTVIQYTDDKLDFRPWYPNGFVYCPVCRTPLRHSEELAVSGTPGNAKPAYPQQTAPVQPAQAPVQPAPAPVEPAPVQQAPVAQEPIATAVAVNVCPNCNKEIREGDVFCSGCGTKL